MREGRGAIKRRKENVRSAGQDSGSAGWNGSG